MRRGLLLLLTVAVVAALCSALAPNSASAGATEERPSTTAESNASELTAEPEGPCSVTRICDYPYTGSVSCSGQDCVAGPDYVECDGQVFNCPICSTRACTNWYACDKWCSANGLGPGACTNNCCECIDF
jgi:hypothetical protein